MCQLGCPNSGVFLFMLMHQSTASWEGYFYWMAVKREIYIVSLTRDVNPCSEEVWIKNSRFSQNCDFKVVSRLSVFDSSAARNSMVIWFEMTLPISVFTQSSVFVSGGKCASWVAWIQAIFCLCWCVTCEDYFCRMGMKRQSFLRT